MVPLSPNIIEYLKTYRKGVITSSIVTLQSKQRILSIDTNKDKKGLVPGSTIPYDIKMDLLYEGQNKTTIFFGTNKKNFRLFIPDGAGYKVGSLSDLKSGDNIILERKFQYNVLGRDFANNIFTQITKINQ